MAHRVGLIHRFDMVLDAGDAGNWVFGGKSEKDYEQQRLFGGIWNVDRVGIAESRFRGNVLTVLFAGL